MARNPHLPGEHRQCQRGKECSEQSDGPYSVAACEGGLVSPDDSCLVFWMFAETTNMNNKNE